MDLDAYKEEVKIHVQENRKLNLAQKALRRVIWGQYSPNVEAKLKIATVGIQWEENGDYASLLKLLCQITMDCDHYKNGYAMMDKHILEFYALKQGDEQGIHSYKETFETMIKNREDFGGSVCEHPILERSVIEENGLNSDDPDIPELVKQVHK